MDLIQKRYQEASIYAWTLPSPNERAVTIEKKMMDRSAINIIYW